MRTMEEVSSRTIFLPFFDEGEERDSEEGTLRTCTVRVFSATELELDSSPSSAPPPSFRSKLTSDLLADLTEISNWLWNPAAVEAVLRAGDPPLPLVVDAVEGRGAEKSPP